MAATFPHNATLIADWFCFGLQLSSNSIYGSPRECLWPYLQENSTEPLAVCSFEIKSNHSAPLRGVWQGELEQRVPLAQQSWEFAINKGFNKRSQYQSLKDGTQCRGHSRHFSKGHCFGVNPSCEMSLVDFFSTKRDPNDTPILMPLL